MPGFYDNKKYDISGTIVGVVEKEKMLSNKKVAKGDILIGLPSNGLHTNGYSGHEKYCYLNIKLVNIYQG